MSGNITEVEMEGFPSVMARFGMLLSLLSVIVTVDILLQTSSMAWLNISEISTYLLHVAIQHISHPKWQLNILGYNQLPFLHIFIYY